MTHFSSTQVTNAIADPTVKTDVSKWQGRKRTLSGGMVLPTVVATDTLNLAKIPGNAAVQAIDVFAVGTITALLADVGLLDALGAVVNTGSEDAYAAAADMEQAAGVGPNLAFNNRTPEKMGQRVWQDAGFTVDPMNLQANPVRDFYIGLTFTTVTTVSATNIGWEILFTID